jgi:hypothetical protein
MDNSSDWKGNEVNIIPSSFSNNNSSHVLDDVMPSDNNVSSLPLLDDHYSSSSSGHDFSDILCNICPGVCLCNINHCIQPQLVYDSSVTTGDLIATSRY